MKAELQALFDRMQKLQMDMHSVLGAIASRISGESIPDLVDSGFLCREIAGIADDLRKNCNDRQALIGKMLAMRATSAHMSTGEVLKLQGELATAVPDVTTKPRIPDPGTEEYNELMRWIGCSDELIQRGMVRPSFSSLKDVLTKATIEGKNPPPGISLTFTEATVVFRRRRKPNGKQEDF